MKIYLNWNGPQGKETIDELNRKDFSSFKEYRAERKRLLAEYAMAGMSGYWSQRACANWK